MSPGPLPWLVLVGSLAVSPWARPALGQEPPAPDHGVPACRIDRKLPRVVIRTARLAFEAVARRHPGKLGRLAINDLSSRPGELSLLFVKDALDGSTDAQGCPRFPVPDGDGSLRSFDPLSVQGICVADAGEVRCSSEAIRALISIEQEQPSPTLLFLLAHELSHVALGHPGAFNQASVVLDLASPADEKILHLGDLCRIDRSQLEREEQADGEALTVMGELFARRPFRRLGRSAFDAIAGNGEIVYETSRQLAGWAGLHYGAIDSDPATDHPCELVLGREGSLNVPVYGGSHPHVQDRLSRIVNTIGDYVNDLPFTENELIELQGRLAILNMNRLTDRARAIGLQQATDQFCAAVDQLETGSLDCASWVPSGKKGVIKVELPKMERASDREFPLTPPVVPGPYREVPAERARALILYLKAARGLPKEAQALAAAPRLVDAYNRFSLALEKNLKNKGGFWLTEHRQPVVVRHHIFSNSYHAGGLIWGILRIPQDLDPELLDGWDELAAWGVRRYQILPWDDFRSEVVLHFFTRTPSDLGDKRLLTHELGLDQLFDRARALSGERDAINPQFADLLRFTRESLERRYGERFTLDDPEDEEDPFYIAFRGDSVNENLYLPTTWIAIALESRSEPKYSNEQLVAMLSRLSDYGQGPRMLSPEEFKAIFNEPGTSGN